MKGFVGEKGKGEGFLGGFGDAKFRGSQDFDARC